jgi:hypothetical protein
MRITRLGWIILGTFLLAGTVAFVLLRGHRMEYALPDGTVMRVQRVSFGKHELIPPSTRYEEIKERILNKLPRSLTKRFYTPPAAMRPGWTTSSPPVHTNQDALQIWITRRDPATRKFANVGVTTAQIVDEHGCIFLCTVVGGEDPGLLPPVTGMANSERSSITWLTFESFPRRARTLRLRLFDQHTDTLMGEFVLPNPAPPAKSAANWKPEPLPICRTNGEIVYALKTLTTVTNWQYRGGHESEFRDATELEPFFEVRTNGRVAPGWVLGDLEATDSEGNFAPRPGRLPIFLCREAAAWKLVVKFFGPDNPHPASKATWTVKGVEIPAPGEFTTVDLSRDLNGVQVYVAALAGPGKVTYNDGAVTQSAPATNLGEGQFSMSGSADRSKYDISSSLPHLGLQIGSLKPEQWLVISVVDDLGRRFDLGTSSGGSIGRPTAFAFQSRLRQSRAATGSMQFPTLSISSGAKTLDFTFTLEEAYTEEFIFKPPQPDKK